MPGNYRSKGHILIKKLGPRDKRVAKQLFYFFQRDDGKKPVPVKETFLSQMLSKQFFHVLVAYKNNMLAGGLTAYELPMYKNKSSEMFLFEIGVKKEFRQQGVGRSLIEHLKKMAQEKKMNMMFVLTSPRNNAAIKLYKASGGVRQKNIFVVIPIVAPGS